MTSTFPDSVDDWQDPSGASALSTSPDGRSHAQHHTDLNDVVLDMESQLVGPAFTSSEVHDDQAEEVLHNAESLSDSAGVWAAAGTWSGAVVALDAAIFTTGTHSVVCELAYPSGSGTTNKLYVDLVTPLAVGGHPRVAIDVRWTTAGSGKQKGFELVVASGAGLTGTTTTLQIGDSNVPTSATWATVEIPLTGTGITSIASVGVRKRAAATGGSGSTHVKWWLDNVVAAAATGLDGALVSSPTGAILIPATYTSGVTQAAHTLEATQSIVDLRPTHSNLTGFRGIKDVRDWNIDETGATDVSSELDIILASLSPGDTLSFPPDGIFWIEQGINLSTNVGVTLECHGARFTEHVHRQGSVINLSGSFNTIRDMHVIGLGTASTLTNGSSLILVAGTPTNVSTTKSLATAGDTVRIQGQGTAVDAVAQTYSRDVDGYIQFDLVLSQASPITNDVTVTVTDSYNHPSSFPQNVSYTDTFTVTSTPTTYPIRFQPIDLFPGHMLTITKVHTGSPLIVTSYTPYHLMENLVYLSDEGSNHGLNVSGDHCAADNVFVEGMGGDGIQFTGPSLNNTQPNWPMDNRITNFRTRATGRHGITLSHGTNNKLENFIIYNQGRDGMDIEPEGDQSHISNMTFKDGILSGGENGGMMISSAPERQDHVIFDNVWFRANGGSPLLFDIGVGSIIRDCRVTSEDGTGVGVEFQGGTAGHAGALGMRVEGFHTQNKITVVGDNIKLRDIHCERLVQEGTLIVTAAGCDIDGVLIGDPTAPYTIDPTLKFTPVMLMDDTTYRDIQCPAWSQEFSNTYRQAVVQGNPWYPGGLEMLGQGVRTLRGLSSTDVSANNLSGIGTSVTTGATTKTVAFPVKTGVLNPTNFSLTASGPETTNIFMDPGPGENSGTWTLTYNGQTTTAFTEDYRNPVPPDVHESAAAVQAALQALSTIGAGNVTVSGSNIFNNGFTLTWGATFAPASGHTALLTGTSLVTDKNDNTKRVQVNQSSTGGSVAPGTYYYRVAGRTPEGGPLAGLAQKSVVVGATQNQVTIALSGLGYDQATDKAISGWTVWRGTVNGGPYTRRYDVISPPFGLDTSLIDHGTDFGGNIVPQDGSWTAAEINADQTGYEQDTSYGVFVVPSWATTVGITAKRTNGFDITFGTAAPGGGPTIDWFLVR